MNVLDQSLQVTIATLRGRGCSQREITRRTGVDRKTIRRYARLAASPTPATGSQEPLEPDPPPWPPALEGEGPAPPPGPPAMGAEGQIPPPWPPALEEEGQTPPPWPPALEAGLGEVGGEPSAVVVNVVAPTWRAATSACAAHQTWIKKQVQQGRNAVSIYQDLVETYGFEHRYNSVKRFVAKLRARDPERFDVLEFLPGEEAQVDFGQGAPTRQRSGRYRRPWLFVMTLKYSGKSFRTTVWKADQEAWARLHEQAFLAFGGVTHYVVLDNLKVGVLRPDIYEPALNPVYAALLAHYGTVGDPCRVEDPNRKGTVENAVQHTQTTALKGRQFESIEDQNTWLEHWEERWAAPRIHGRKKRQVLEMFHEEQPHLLPLPATRFRCFEQARRTVDDGGLIQVNRSYYAALPAPLGAEVTVRIYDHEIEILDLGGQLLRRHARSVRPGSFTLEAADRIFNPSRETARLLHKAQQIGPQTAVLAQRLFARLGRPGQKALYGLTNLPRTYPCADIEAVCARLVAGQCYAYSTVRRALEHRTATPTRPATGLAPGSRTLDDYQSFWDAHTQEEPSRAHVDPRA